MNLTSLISIVMSSLWSRSTSLESCEDGSEVDDLDPLISSSQSAYTHTFTSPAPEQRDSQPKDSEPPTPINQSEDVRMKVPKLPIEIVDYIASFLLASCPSGCFFHIHSFSLACSQFRRVILRHYFSSVRFVSARQLASYTDIHFSLMSRNNLPDSVGFDCVKCGNLLV